jgi:hypothetical protein
VQHSGDGVNLGLGDVGGRKWNGHLMLESEKLCNVIVLKGHDFSRAEKAARNIEGFSP